MVSTKAKGEDAGHQPQARSKTWSPPLPLPPFSLPTQAWFHKADGKTSPQMHLPLLLPSPLSSCISNRNGHVTHRNPNGRSKRPRPVGATEKRGHRDIKGLLRAQHRADALHPSPLSVGRPIPGGRKSKGRLSPGQHEQDRNKNSFKESKQAKQTAGLETGKQSTILLKVSAVLPGSPGEEAKRRGRTGHQVGRADGLEN